MKEIQQFEKPRPAGYTQTAWDCRNQMLAKLAGHVPMQTAAPRQPMVHELPANQIASRLLTPKQAEGVEIVRPHPPRYRPNQHHSHHLRAAGGHALPAGGSQSVVAAG